MSSAAEQTPAPAPRSAARAAASPPLQPVSGGICLSSSWPAAGRPAGVSARPARERLSSERQPWCGVVARAVVPARATTPSQSPAARRLVGGGRRGSAEQIYFQRVQSGVPGEHSYRPVGSGLDCSFLGVQFDGGVAD